MTCPISLGVAPVAYRSVTSIIPTNHPILLAQELDADLLLLDDMKPRRTASDRGFTITGILGILDQAASMKLIDLPAAVQSLKNTSF